ncbi:FlgO family outer membrane protein [Aliiglaciecola sp. CAU 1673]|uniref:FlgO family outer membrane protein n=1 Tax=Aliiglaciecola sp. CAU 1673 TaxID=3032595 RepID=UPI0023DC158E|nr:FlgO family outer membrane protein [Aliiglaciecola sp. CAU 1673]MDF2178046.1 FlgO family outer membrane protein [Aliiglaciecola sp. CAU 1673]
MKLINPILSLTAVAMLAGCADSFSFMQQEPDMNEAEPGHVVNIVAYEGPQAVQPGTGMSVDAFGAVKQSGNQPAFMDKGVLYQGHPLTKHVGSYVQNMTQDLISNMEYVSDQTPIGVTHFALLDSDLQQTNLLGYQLAESFMHELHKFRIPVLDYKSTEYVRVTEDGDFVLSRDFLELKERVPMDYVLTGTLTRHQGGYLVNARVLGMRTKAVVATAQTLIPFYVVDALLPSEAKDKVDGVKLTKG